MLWSNIRLISLFLLTSAACLAPTSSFSITATGDNMYIEGTGVGWRPASYISCTERTGATYHLLMQADETSQDSGYFHVTLGFLRFNTSSIPDNAVITGARLRLHVLNVYDPVGVSIYGEWYSAANWPISCKEDYTSVPSQTAFSVQASLLTTGSYNTFSLDNLSSINKTGYTGLRLHIVTQFEPVPYPGHYVMISAYNISVNVPVLEVDYIVPGLQVVVIDGD